VEEALSLKKMLVLSGVYLIVLAAGSWMMSSWSFAWAVLAGGVISIGSFWFSYRDVRVFFNSLASEQELQSEKERLKESKKGYILKFWLRIFLIGLVLLFLITLGNINIFGLILGLTTVVFTITISAFGVVWRYYFSRR
jgi:hypothetical protein